MGLCASAFAAGVSAQQVVNPGDIIVERDVTPRSAFASVPKSQDPVLVRATTFPKNSFDPAMATLVNDTDLTNARGNSGVPAKRQACRRSTGFSSAARRAARTARSAPAAAPRWLAASATRFPAP